MGIWKRWKARHWEPGIRVTGAWASSYTPLLRRVAGWWRRALFESPGITFGVLLAIAGLALAIYAFVR